MTAMPRSPRRSRRGAKIIVDQIWDGAPDEAERQRHKSERRRGKMTIRFGKKRRRRG